MARIRTIKPDFWTDDAVAQLSPTAMLLFIGMWNFADDDGYLRDSVGQLRRQIFPDRGWDVTGALDELLNLGRAVRKDSDQGPLLLVAHLREHQKISHPTPTKFTGIREPGTQPPESSGTFQNFPESSAPREGRKEGNGKEGRGSAADATPPVDNSEPPIRCAAHATAPRPPACGLCKDARVAHEAWEKTQVAATPARASAWRPGLCRDHLQAEDACEMCAYENAHAAEVIHGRFGQAGGAA